MNDVDRRDVWAQLTRISLITLPALLVFMVFDQAPYLFDTFNRGQVFGRDAHNLWIAGRILLEERSAMAQRGRRHLEQHTPARLPAHA